MHSLHLHQFRSHDDALFEFGTGITAIVGPNGSGKTNLLEAIYTLATGKSFRDGDDELISHTKTWYRIEGLIDDTQRELRYQPGFRGKQLLTDGVSRGRFTYRYQLPVVLFEPDDLLMIHGAPGGRRQYIDDLLTKLSPQYRQILQRYERVLTQRNNLLKQRQPLSLLKNNLFVWDISLSDLGAKMITARQEMVERINTSLSETYSHIAGSEQILKLEYHYPHTQTNETQIAHALHRHFEDDVRRGFTGVGPHRHDIGFILNDQPAKTTASRGEVRSVVLSLKVAEMQLLNQSHGSAPLLLCDDVFSELDEHRRASLVTYATDGQMIITTTDTLFDNGATITLDR